MNKKKILGYMIGIFGGYFLSYYFISPFIFKSADIQNHEKIIQTLDAELDTLRRQLPLHIENDSTLIAIDRRQLKVAYTYEVNPAMVQKFSNTSQKLKLCEHIKDTFKFGIQYDYIYKDERGTILSSIPVNAESCSI